MDRPGGARGGRAAPRRRRPGTRPRRLSPGLCHPDRGTGRLRPRPRVRGPGRAVVTAALMIQGCGSDVGKSTLTAGLCRLFTDRGLRVRPFKPQNMSNNAAVTKDGGEIGRAQALQARACRIAPTVDMNPVLLKPTSDVGAQLVVRGRMRGNWTAGAWRAQRSGMLDIVLDSFRRLSAEADLVL